MTPIVCRVLVARSGRPQLITVELRDEGGQVLDRLAQDAPELARLLPPIGDPDFPMLGLVDPYSDTYFSTMQMRGVIPELRRLEALTPDARRVLDDLLELADLCADGIGLYLVLIGD